MSRAREERTLAFGKFTLGRPRTDRPGEYHGTVAPVPNFLTNEQLLVVDHLAAAGEVGVEDVRTACRREGLGLPDPAAVAAELDLRRAS